MAEAPPALVEMGEGLLGQCALERRMQLIETGPAGFATIRSGLGERAPAALMLGPILLNDKLLGVVELALLTQPGPAEAEQLEEITRLLAMNLEILGRNAQAAPAAAPPLLEPQ